MVQCDRIRYEEEIGKVRYMQEGMREKEVHVCDVGGYEKGEKGHEERDGRQRIYYTYIYRYAHVATCMEDKANYTRTCMQ